MQATIDRNIDDALSQSESISRTQQQAAIEIGSDEFLDIALGLKKSLIQSTPMLKELNDALILAFNRNPEGVFDLIPKLNELLILGIKSIKGIKGSVVGKCVGKTVLGNYQIEVNQLQEAISDIENKKVKPSSALQSLYDQL